MTLEEENATLRELLADMSKALERTDHYGAYARLIDRAGRASSRAVADPRGSCGCPIGRVHTLVCIFADQLPKPAPALDPIQEAARMCRCMVQPASMPPWPPVASEWCMYCHTGGGRHSSGCFNR